jgi:hypothetical protein
LFQLDQLGAAVRSPLRAAMKHQKQAVGSAEIRERPQIAVLIGKGEIGNVLAELRPCCVAIVGCAHKRRVQLIGDRFADVEPPN